MRFVGRTGSSATGVRDFAIIGIASMAAVSVPAAPAMGLLIVDSMTVPVDQRYSEGMLGAFSLIARVCLIVGVCLVKGGGKTYHWVVDVRRKPTIKPPTWPTLPPPFTPAFTRRKNACRASSTRLAEAIRLFRLQPGHQRLAGGIRFGLQPDQHLTPNTLEGVLAGPPAPRTSDPGRVSRSDLTLAP